MVQVMVITGDNKLTAEAICRTIGVFAEGESLKGKSMTGREFVELPLAERKAILQVCTGFWPPHGCRIFVLICKNALVDAEVFALTWCLVHDRPNARSRWPAWMSVSI